MGTIAKVTNLWRNLDVEEEAVNTILETKEDLIDLNQSQLLEGKNKVGQKLKSYRNWSYAKMKNAKNSLPGFGIPDLFNKGNFFAGFKIRFISKKSFEFYSTDDKNSMLVKKYGQDIFGLQDESREEYLRRNFKPVFFDRLNKKLS